MRVDGSAIEWDGVSKIMHLDIEKADDCTDDQVLFIATKKGDAHFFLKMSLIEGDVVRAAVFSQKTSPYSVRVYKKEAV